MTPELAKKYELVWIPRDMAEAPDELILSTCNGVGPSGWINHAIPNSNWGLDMTGASDGHDWMYTYPLDADLSYKDFADRVFHANMLALIDAAAKQSWTGRMLRPLRIRRADVYFLAVQKIGYSSFMKGKQGQKEIFRRSRGIGKVTSGGGSMLLEVSSLIPENADPYDGDTVFFDFPGLPDIFGKRMGFRLARIDAPEMHDKRPATRALAWKAAKALEDLVGSGGQLSLVDVHRDKFFRLRGELLVGDVNASEFMLRSGLVKPYHGEGDKPW